MSRFVVFNGIVKFTPGALVKVTPSPVPSTGLSANGIVAILGEAEGGLPDSIFEIDDPSLAEAIFRSGPLADAVKVAFNPSQDSRIPGGASRVLAVKTNQSTQSSIQVPGATNLVSDTSTGASTTTVLTVTTGGLTPDEHIGRWVLVNGEYRRITDNDATTITLTPALSAAPVITDPVLIKDSQMVLTSEDYGAHTTQVGFAIEDGVATDSKVVTITFEDDSEESPDIGGEAFLRLKYLGGAAIDAGNVDSATALVVTVDVAAAPGANEYDGKLLVFSDGTQRLIASHTAADPAVITLDSAHALSAAQQAAFVGTTATIKDVDSAAATITGASGLATGLTTAVLPVADDLSITFSNNQTLRSLVDQINATTNYEATIPGGVNPDTTLMETFDFGTRNIAVDVRFDDEQDPDNDGSFRRDLQVIVDWINNNSVLVSAAKADTDATEGSELPIDTSTMIATSDPIYLVGGIRGISANSDWQNAFDELIKVRANSVIPLISQDLTNEGYGSTATFASVAAQLGVHVQNARGVDQSERGGYMGMVATRDELVAQARSFDDEDVQISGQKITTLDVTGTIKEMDEWALAVTMAGMRAGAPEVGEPLTFKKIRASAVTNDSSWDTTSRTDRNRLTENGVCFAEAHPNGGFRILRDMTTHLRTDNLTLIEGSVRDAVRFTAYEVRTTVEDQFTGEKGTRATVASVRDTVAAKFEELLEANVLVASNDPEDPTSGKIFPGFRNLKVSLSGNTLSIKAEIFPVTGITFELIDLSVTIPVITV